jgi:8-oxo-dGTP pyrophosphatase MutT (NUDIX family)
MSDPNPKDVTKFRVAIYGVLVEGHSVLMTETKVPSGTTMNFPGGGLELGEAPLAALQREFLEETGCSVVVGELLFASQRFQQNPDYPSEQLMHLYYRVHREKEEVTSAGNGDDVVGTAWIQPEKISLLRIMPADLEFILSDKFSELFT